MTIDSVAAVQTRIAQIRQLVAAPLTGAGTDGSAAPAAGSTSAAVATGSASASPSGAAAAVTQSPEFGSLLADAMASGATGTDPLSDPGNAATASSTGSSMLSQLLAQLGPATSNTGMALGGGGATATGGDMSMLSSLAALTGSGTTAATAGGLAGLTGLLAPGAAPTAINPTTQLFLNTALAQQGKPYVYGATAQISDPDPPAFDCSELTKWAAARSGVTIPDGATAQYLYIRDHGDTMTVQQALHTPGALLFHFGHEPKNLGDIPADGHVAISLGDGVHTIEARGHAYGTNVFANASGREFNFAGMIPAMA